MLKLIICVLLLKRMKRTSASDSGASFSATFHRLCWDLHVKGGWGVIGKVTRTRPPPPFCTASLHFLFSIRPPDWCTEGADCDRSARIQGTFSSFSHSYSIMTVEDGEGELPGFFWRGWKLWEEGRMEGRKEERRWDALRNGWIIEL